MTRRQKAIIRRRIFLSACAAVLAVIIFGIYALVNLIIDISKNDNKPSSNIGSSSTVSSSEEEVVLTSSATVLSIGDIMAHGPQLKGAYNSSTDKYDFSAFFKEAKPYFEKADLCVGNLEVTFGGEAAGSYRGYPSFNTPDSLADYIKDAKISLLLTANNHSYDTGLSGLKRTAQVLEEKKISFTGTRQKADDDKYIIKNVNGIKIAVANFTYETTAADSEEGRKYLNGITLSTEANDLINSFSYVDIEAFYKTAEEMIADMKENGAEFISFYMHWGEEYQLKQNTWQKTIAQKLCNLGVDMIIGGHPHVVQPIELLHSEDSQNTTICVYSLGNAVSNQRKGLISACKTGHTEDGLMFSYTLEKYSDGTVNLVGVDAIPTWVNRYYGNVGYLYTICPLESANLGGEKSASFERTKAIIAEGLTECQKYLGCEIKFKEEQQNTP